MTTISDVQPSVGCGVDELAVGDEDRQQQPQQREHQSEHADQAQPAGAAGEHHPPEVRDQGPQRVAGGAVLPLVAQLHRRGRHATGHPAQRDVEVDPRSGVRRDAAADLAEHQPIAVEHRGVRAAAQCGDHPLGRPRRRVAQPSVRARVDGPGVDDTRLLVEGDVQHRPDVRRVVLAVLVEGDDPVPAGGGHPGERGGVLAVVAAEPDHPDERVGLLHLAQQAGRVAGTAVVDEEDLRHPERRPRRGDRRTR